MKKAFLPLLAFASCISISAQTKTVISGDYDGDGQITVGDVEYMAGIVLGSNQAMELDVVIQLNGHDCADLGVIVDGKPVYWATTNIGAESPADCGLYFAWGETVGYSEDIYDGREFDWPNYSSVLCGGEYNKMKKYCTNSEYGTVDNNTILYPDDDAAHVNWKGAWRMPTYEE